MTNRMGHHNTKFPLPSSLQTSWEQGNSSLPTWNSCSLKWMRDEFTFTFSHHSLAKHVIKTSASWQTCFRGARRQKTSEITPEPVLSLWWLLGKTEHPGNFTRSVTKFCVLVSEHLPFVDLRESRKRIHVLVHAMPWSSTACAKQVLLSATSSCWVRTQTSRMLAM